MKSRSLLIGCLAIAVGVVAWYWTTREVAGTQPPPAAEMAIDDSIGLRALSKDSDLIVTGRCTGTKSVWVENNRILVTLATIEVADTLKGSSQDSVTVVLPGGSDSNRKFPVAMTYAGAPTIFENEEVFLFLTAESLVEGGFAVSGFNQGKFTLGTDQDGNVLVTNGPSRGPISGARGAAPGHLGFGTLSDFTARVRQYIAQ